MLHQLWFPTSSILHRIYTHSVTLSVPSLNSGRSMYCRNAHSQSISLLSASTRDWKRIWADEKVPNYFKPKENRIQLFSNISWFRTLQLKAAWCANVSYCWTWLIYFPSRVQFLAIGKFLLLPKISSFLTSQTTSTYGDTPSQSRSPFPKTKGTDTCVRSILGTSTNVVRKSTSNPSHRIPSSLSHSGDGHTDWPFSIMRIQLSCRHNFLSHYMSTYSVQQLRCKTFRRSQFFIAFIYLSLPEDCCLNAA